MRLAAPAALAAVALVTVAAPDVAAQPGAMTPASPPPAPSQPAYPSPGYPGAGPSYTPAPYAPYAPHRAAPRAIKSESTATWLSIGTTALGFGAMMVAAEERNDALAWAGIAGVLVGPSAGHIYAGENGHAVKMSLLRTGGLVVFAVGALSASSRPSCPQYCSYDDDNGEAAMWLGGALVVGATLYDFWDAGRAVRRFNDKQQHSYMVAPTMLSSPAGATPGVALAGQF